MSKIISQNELDAKQISDSVKNFFDRFQVSRLLKASNVLKKKGESPVNVMKYAFSLVFRNRSMYMDKLLGNDVVSFSKDTYYRFMNSIHSKLDPLYVIACFKDQHECNCTSHFCRQGKRPNRG